MKVLIVDDNAVNLQMFGLLLKRLDIECVAHPFADPRAALSWCQTAVPDLVLLDYMMPGLDGIEFLTHFRSNPVLGEIPVVFVTADHERELRYRALAAGASDFLTKPIDKTEFSVRVRNLLALRRSQRALADRAAWLADEVHKEMARATRREREAIFLLAKAAEHRDPETGAHIQRMAHFVRLIGERLGLMNSAIDLMFEAAPMHDIGKVGIPDAILLKPGRLDDDEFAIMKRHAEIGWRILSGGAADNNLLAAAAEIAYSHHEKFDGSGYPRGLAGDEIPLSGRIVAVADVFDALTSQRPYKNAWSLDDASDFLRSNCATHFDPQCVDAFFAAWDEVLAIRASHPDD